MSRRMSRRIDLTCGVEIEAAAGESSSPPTFRMLAYTGDVMQPDGWAHGVIVRMDGVTLRSNRTPILLDHDRRLIVGHATDVRVESGRLVVDGVISGTGAAAQEVVSTSRNGFPWSASIGARATKPLVYIAEGQTSEVNGRKVRGPLYVVEAAELAEVSFVAIGADRKATASVAATGVTNMEYEAWVEARGFDASALSDQQRATLRAAYESECGAPAPSVDASSSSGDAPAPDEQEARRLNAAAEIERQAAIEAACGSDRRLAARAIREGWSPEKAELEMLRAQRSVPSGGAPEAGSGRAPVTPVTIECAASMTLGAPEAELRASYGDRVVEAAAKQTGFGLCEMIRLLAAASGLVLPGHTKSSEWVRAAFGAHEIANVLENVARKTLLRSYNAVPQQWSAIAAVEAAADFKPSAAYELSTDGTFEEISPDGELKQAKLTDSKYTLTPSTYGAVVSVTHKDVVNDDLGALNQTPALFGRAAAHRVNTEVFTLLLSNPSSFFATGNRNYFEGASTALSIESLRTATQTAEEQIGPDSAPMNVMMKTLLVPPALHALARTIFTSQLIQSTANTRQPSHNEFASMFEPVSSPYLGTAGGLSGASNTAWYLVADPADVPLMRVGFVGGRRAPVVERVDPPSNFLGLRWRAYLDFGVGMGNHRAAVKSKGAA